MPELPSGILIVDDEARKEAARERAILIAESRARGLQRFRDAVLDSLADLDERLKDFEQTTHGRMGPATMRALADELEAAWDCPTGYNISNLSQGIRALLKLRSE